MCRMRVSDKGSNGFLGKERACQDVISPQHTQDYYLEGKAQATWAAAVYKILC